MTQDYFVEQLKQRFQGKESFTREELFNFYHRWDPQLNENTFRWRIYNLKEKKIIRALSKSEFSLSYKPEYRPEIDKRTKEIYSLVDREFPSLKKGIWSTRWVTEFMLHLPGGSWILLEVEKDSTESVFHFLKDSKYKEVFWQPEEKEIDRYISGSSQAIIIKPLVSQAPLHKVRNVRIPRIEKILVDIFIEKHLFNVFQGKELSVIFNNVYNQYQVNFSKLMTYARRRGKEKELSEFISLKTDIPKNLFND